MHASNAQATARSSNLMSIEAYLASKNLTVGMKKPTAKVIKMDTYRPRYSKYHKPVDQFDHIDWMSIYDEEVKYRGRMFEGKVDETTQPTAQSGKETHHEMCSKAHHLAVKYIGKYGEIQTMHQPMFKGVERNHRRQPMIQIGSLAPYDEKKQKCGKKKETN